MLFIYLAKDNGCQSLEMTFKLLVNMTQIVCNAYFLWCGTILCLTEKYN